MSFLYDPAGNRSQRTEYNGGVTNYSYDDTNRLTTISYPDTTSATYGCDDVLSRLTLFPTEKELQKSVHGVFRRQFFLYRILFLEPQ
jgi:hypothetical protein